MNITNVRKAYARTTVTVLDVTTETDDQILDAALTAAGETRGSLFGTRVFRNGDGEPVIVHLFTD